jgi:hypothetical protein
VKHASPAALDQLEPLLLGIRRLGRLREKNRGVFYHGTTAFLHFHEDPAGLFADVRLDGSDFTRLRVNTKTGRNKLLAGVRRVLRRSSSR